MTPEPLDAGKILLVVLGVIGLLVAVSSIAVYISVHRICDEITRLTSAVDRAADKLERKS